MPKLVVDMGNPDQFTTGLSKDEIKKIAWAQFLDPKVGSGKRAIIIADMLKYRLPAQVRLNDDRFKREDTNVAVKHVAYGYEEHDITDEWQDVDANFAYALWVDSQEQVHLGAPTYAVELQETLADNGTIVYEKVPVSVEGVTMFDFRFKHEGGLVTATR